MSFNKYSKYIFDFELLDKKFPDEQNQERYYNRWMEKYNSVFETENNFKCIEWDLRCKKSLKEIFSSATFFIEAKKNLETKCFSSYYFCLYYSLFHALYALTFLDPYLEISKLLSTTHLNLINRFINSFSGSKKNIIDENIKKLFNDLKYKREYYSYCTPFNNLFNPYEDIDVLETELLVCYQLCAFHSLMIEKSYQKKCGTIVTIDKNNYLEFNKTFNQLFSKINTYNEYVLDDSCKNIYYEILQYGSIPQYISIDLEHQFDEFHTYDSFYKCISKSDLNILDIWAVICNAIS
uniref:hypothetical protein n=1 Tax=Eubacterium sp. TaxID=142586 RepID=UPI003FEE4DE2